MTEKHILKLYVTGKTANSQAAIKNLNDILEREPKDLYTLDVIDVSENPQAAEEDKILATPTLIRFHLSRPEELLVICQIKKRSY